MAYSLLKYNTLGIDVTASSLLKIKSIEDLQALDTNYAKYTILGGGSNVLLTRHIDKTVLLNVIHGRTIVSEVDQDVLVYVGGGEHWHDIVMWSLELGFGGLENLSLIPGTVGAAPIQNIGAYGVEFKDVVKTVYAYHFESRQVISFSTEQCAFGYRDSFFKKPANKGQYFITGVEMLLHKNVNRVNTSYGAISQKLIDMQVDNPSCMDVSKAVMAIRSSKLPNPNEIGNAGSFFKNPVVELDVLKQIEKSYESVPHYVINDQYVKIPAGWLIEQCGWKGHRVQNVGNYDYQALIIVNWGNATGQEVLEHAQDVQQSVLDMFGIPLEFEVNVL